MSKKAGRSHGRSILDSPLPEPPSLSFRHLHPTSVLRTPCSPGSERTAASKRQHLLFPAHPRALVPPVSCRPTSLSLPECQSGPLWSRPGCQLGHARYTERGPCGSLAGAGVANTFHKSPSETAPSTACRNLRGRNTSGEGLLLSLPLPADSQFHSQLALPAMLPLSHPWPRWPCPALYGTLCHLGKQSHRHRLPGSERDGAGPNPACVSLAVWLLACRVTLRVQQGC